MNKLIMAALLLTFLSGCNEEIRAARSAEKAKLNELTKFHGKSLSVLTCENIDRQYERCDEYYLYAQIEYCQSKYTPVLMRCYGVKSN